MKNPCIEAALKGDIESLRTTYSQLMDLYCDYYPYDALHAAAIAGSVECIIFAVSKGVTWKQNILKLAVKSGSLECVEYFYNEGCEWSEDTCATAAMEGHLEILKFCRERGCPWNKMTTVFAFKKEIMQYAHENGCPWDAWTTTNMAWTGSLDSLKYAHENGCIWTDMCVYNACLSGNFECLKYAVENGCSMGGIEGELVTAAIQGKNVDCLRYIHEVCGYPITFRRNNYIHNAMTDYINKHHYRVETSQNTCPLCAWERGNLFAINFSDPKLSAYKPLRPILQAQRKIYRSMERAYINPEYSWCISRLKRDFSELLEDTKFSG